MKSIPASPLSLVFFRSLIGLLIFSPFFIWRKEELKTKKLPSHLLRTLLSLMGIYCSVYGVQHLNLGDAILLEQTAPFFIVAIFFFWRKEKTSLPTLIAMGVAFVGVMLIISPQFAIFKLSSLASIASGLLAGLCFIAVEALVKTETSLSTLFYFLLISTLVSAVPALRQSTQIDFVLHWPFLLLIGLFFALSQLLRNVALTFINSNVVGSYSYFAPLFSILLGVMFLDEVLTYNRILGSILILGAGIYIYYEKRQQETPA